MSGFLRKGFLHGWGDGAITSEEETSTQASDKGSSDIEYAAESSEDENQGILEGHSEKDQQKEEPIKNDTLQQPATQSALLRNDSISSSEELKSLTSASLSSASYIKPDNEKNQAVQNVKQPEVKASPSELELFNYHIKKAHESLASYYNSNPIIRERLDPIKSNLDSLESNLQCLLTGQIYPTGTRKRLLDNAEKDITRQQQGRSKIIKGHPSLFESTSSTASQSLSDPTKKPTSEEEQTKGTSEEQAQDSPKFGHHK